MKKQSFLRLSVAVALALGASSSATFAANDTTASLKGLVNVDDAKVTIEYEPTGITKSRDLGDENNFAFSFLPVGGPYTISVTAEGYEPIKIENVYLALYEKNNMNFELKKVGANDERLVIIGSKSAAGQNAGTGSTLYRDDMNAIPSVNRSIADFARMDPRINLNAASTNIEISAMGVNNRFNDFQIDGVSFNDPFGLNASGFATARNPISMDFIEQIAVDLTPYDVSRSGATGATISVVTKSGSNEFDGSVYYSSRDEGDFGDLPNGDAFPPFKETITNFTLSGPIIEDKLFFFVGYEEFEKTAPFTYGAAGSGALNESNAPAADFDRIAQIARDVYGFDPGGYENLSFPETATEYVVKLDYNINDDHRVELNYSNKEELNWNNFGKNKFDSVSYSKPPITERTSINYFGDINENLNINATYTHYEFTEDAESKGGLFPEVTVTTDSGDRITLGGEKYRGANFISVKNDTYAFKANYQMDDHLITAGFEYEEGSVQNQFLARYNGEVQFSNIDNFEAGMWSYLRFNVPTAGLNELDSITAAFDVKKTTYYLQDAWTVNDKLNLQYGFRVDSLNTPTAPVENAAFVERYGYSNAQKFDYTVFQPRASFEGDLTEDFAIDGVKSMKLRGGFGLFMGRFPNVWLGNAYSRPGPLSDYRTYRSYTTDIGAMPADAEFFWITSPDSSYTIAPPGSSSASQYVDPNFEAPSTWKGNLGLDLVFTDGTAVTLEYNHDSVEKGLAVIDPGLTQTGSLADGRGTYSTSGSLELTNTSQGEAESFTFTVHRNFFDSLNVYAAYTNTDSKDVWNMTSSQAESNYGYQQRFDGANTEMSRSAYMVEHKFIFSLDYSEQFFGDNETRVSLVFTRQSGEPYSVTYDNGYNSITGAGGFYGGYDLAYIPTGADDPNVVFQNGSAADVMAFINSAGLDKYMGTYAPRNALTSPWVNRLDMRITQEIRFPEYWEMIGENKAIITLDIMNIGGRTVEEYSFNTSRAIITNGTDAEGRAIITGVDTDDNLYTSSSEGQSSWGVRLGFKYEF